MTSQTLSYAPPPPPPEQKTVLLFSSFGPHSTGHTREIQQTIQAFKLTETLKLHIESIHVHNSLIVLIHVHCMVGVPPFCQLHFQNTVHVLDIIRTVALDYKDSAANVIKCRG